MTRSCGITVLAVLLSVPTTGHTQGVQGVGIHRVVEVRAAHAAGLDPDDRWGSAIATLGDLDGNGLTDVAIGARGASGDGAHDGAVWILELGGEDSRRPTRLDDTFGPLSGLLDDYGLFGSALAARPTGLADTPETGAVVLAIGAPADARVPGRCWLVGVSDSGGVTIVRELDNPTPSAGDGFGRATTWLDDLDLDEHAELAIGAPGTNGGRLHLLHVSDGPARRLATIDAARVGVSSNARFGAALCPIGDVDGNGLGDLVVGAPGHVPNADGHRTGTLRLLLLGRDGQVIGVEPLEFPATSFEGGSPAHVRKFGGSLAALGDVEGDGTFEIAVGYETGAPDAPGKIGVLFMSVDTDGRAARHRWLDTRLHTPLSEAGRAPTLAFPGDVDLDGRPELLIGRPDIGDDTAARGRVWLISLDW